MRTLGPGRAGIARLVAGLIVATALFSGCTLFAEPCIQPFPTPSVTAVVRVPTPLPVDAPTLGACGEWVEYQGFFHTAVHVDAPFDAADDGWTITEADLERIGEATGRTANLPGIRGADVYAIDGVEPDEAIAMHGLSSGTIVVFRGPSGGDSPPAALCRYVADGATLAGCSP